MKLIGFLLACAMFSIALAGWVRLDMNVHHLIAERPYIFQGGRAEPYDSALCDFLSVPYQREAAIEIPFELFRLYGDDIVDIELNVSYIYPSEVNGDSIGVAEQEPISLSSQKAASTMPELFVAAQAGACAFDYTDTVKAIGIE